ncbi:bifunctional oligoribonuclease/PAP phosphatase NrnA [Candidatus Nomurabacteria bacterium]|nr:bifunctional oligoribonuclease/PAP phosphatase NrnA [Candidatus Nomurabacteria bacterium]
MHEYQAISQKIKAEIARAQTILVISHQKPDGDTLGSNLAFSQILKQQGKTVTSFCLDQVPELFQFLPHHEQVTNNHLVFSKHYDLVIVVDSGSLNYAGVELLITALKDYKLINIDHHASNPLYGDVNLVIPTASSCAEVIYRLLKDWQIKINSEVATLLACGMITDTGGFINPATSYQVLQAAADLIAQGANLSQISKITLGNKNVNNLKLWGRAFSRLQYVKKYNLVYTFITQKDFLECETDENSAEGISNFLHVLQDAKIILVLKESIDGQIKGSLRTTEDDIDLSKLAGIFGGGGHKKASGFALPGRLSYDKNKLRII